MTLGEAFRAVKGTDFRIRRELGEWLTKAYQFTQSDLMAQDWVIEKPTPIMYFELTNERIILNKGYLNAV